MTCRFKFRPQYEGDEAAGRAAGFDCLNEDGSRQESLTQQSFAQELDLNWIARKYGLLNTDMPVAPVDPKYYGDVTGAPDLRGILEMARDAQEKFMALPPEIRRRFHNDPNALWQFVNKRENWDECIKLGLLQKKEEKAAPSPPSTGEKSVTSSAGSSA